MVVQPLAIMTELVEQFMNRDGHELNPHTLYTGRKANIHLREVRVQTGRRSSKHKRVFHAYEPNVDVIRIVQFQGFSILYYVIRIKAFLKVFHYLLLLTSIILCLRCTKVGKFFCNIIIFYVNFFGILCEFYNETTKTSHMKQICLSLCTHQIKRSCILSCSVHLPITSLR